MKRFALPFIVIISLAGILVFAIRSITIHPNETNTEVPSERNTNILTTTNALENNSTSSIADTNKSSAILHSPVSDAESRITKKPFGIYITPATSPVSPEKFSGYHTGVDFEIFASEQNTDVTVLAVCDGKVLLKQRVSGYGGVFVQSCTINNEDVTVLYGHLALSSISLNVGDTIKSGDRIGFLGAPYSTDTDGERKHLHLGIHKGTAVNYLGYVSTESALSDWIDAESLL
ncbi:MAG: M23 family metallopeptidase [Patescibacteria group bacterium]|jgi:murein DD-endopeptidase MepM/ murein hydrolase activator NlpD